MNNFFNFFRPQVLFNVRPEPLAGLNLQILAYGFGALFVAALLLSFVASSKLQDKYMKKGISRIRNILVATSMVGLLYTFFAFEGAVFLSARFWLVLIALAAAIWMVFPVKYMLKEVPLRRAEIEKKRNLEKYLPR